MKKTVKKLLLNKEAVRHLTNVQLPHVAGGRSSDSFNITVCGQSSDPIITDGTCAC